GGELARGRLAGVPVAICRTGMGGRAARRVVSRCLEQLSPCCLIAAGFGAAITTGPRAGDLVLAEKVIAHPDGRMLASDRSLLEAAASLHAGRLFRGALVSVPRVLCEPAAKKRIAVKYGALAADMESYAVLAAGKASGIPCLAVRAVTDTADEALPLASESMVTTEGQIRRGAVFAAICRQPALIPGLLRLGLHSMRAAGILAEYLEALCAQVNER
ncbi:MAG TPA: hypothetical protein VHR86_02675, partial [Armatimonadota bacterium]|nr:hypothetical protein [Armatimonadota bacterium]